MSKADDTFIREFALILGLLVIFTIAMVVLARGIGGPAMEASRNSLSVVAERTAKIGAVRFEGDAMPATETAATAEAAPAPTATSGGRGGEEIYNLACMACHTTGALEAPKIGDAEAWTPRAAQGLETLVDHAINGFKLMPARGGNATLADDEVRNAVTYILDETGLDVSDAGGVAPSTADSLIAAMTELVAPAANAQQSVPVQVAAADGKNGEEVYQSACFACHMTGAANAPKVGDQKVWQLRIDAGGVDQLVHNALNGKNAMPAKGGNPALEEPDIRNAVLFMLEKSGITP